MYPHIVWWKQSVLRQRNTFLWLNMSWLLLCEIRLNLIKPKVDCPRTRSTVTGATHYRTPLESSNLHQKNAKLISPPTSTNRFLVSRCRLRNAVALTKLALISTRVIWIVPQYLPVLLLFFLEILGKLGPVPKETVRFQGFGSKHCCRESDWSEERIGCNLYRFRCFCRWMC